MWSGQEGEEPREWRGGCGGHDERGGCDGNVNANTDANADADADARRDDSSCK
jgi:hypothetical protein